MKFRKRSVIAGMAFVAVGAVLGGWITAQTGTSPLHAQVTASAQSNVADSVSLKAGFGPVVKRVMPAIVSITSERVVQRTQGSPRNQQEEDLFRRFFGDDLFRRFQVPEGNQRRQGLGSGVITTQDGYILTNNHVVDGANEVKVTLQDRREFTAKVVGTDPLSDVAVLKIDATNLPTAPLGDSSKVEVGDIVLAMGNPFGVGQTVTMGIVGATSRRGMGIEDFEDFIQTDAAINPGNSGGALVSVNGQVIGINTAIITGGGAMIGGGGNQGVGFAIPVNMAKSAMDQIVDTGKVSRGWLGVSIQSVTPEIAKQFNLSGAVRGALVGDVTAGSPADKAGLKRGDIILKLNGTDVPDHTDLRLKVAALKPGSTANFDVFRNGSEQKIAVNLGERPSNEELTSSRRGRGGDTPETKSGAKLGISVSAVTPELRREYGLNASTQGVVITDVVGDSAAAEAGIREGDVVLEVNRTEVRDAAQFQQLVRQASGSVLLLVSREGSTQYVTVTPR